MEIVEAEAWIECDGLAKFRPSTRKNGRPENPDQRVGHAV
jgi:hypothetical protein